MKSNKSNSNNNKNILHKITTRKKQKQPNKWKESQMTKKQTRKASLKKLKGN